MAGYGDDEQKEWEIPSNLKIHHVDLDQESDDWIKLVKLCDQTMNNPELQHQKDWACKIKAELDDDANFNRIDGKGPWHCVVGLRFAAAITHETGCLCAFDIGPQTFLIYKNLAVNPPEVKNVPRNRRASWRMMQSVTSFLSSGVGSRTGTLEGQRGSMMGMAPGSK